MGEGEEAKRNSLREGGQAEQEGRSEREKDDMVRACMTQDLAHARGIWDKGGAVAIF